MPKKNKVYTARRTRTPKYKHASEMMRLSLPPEEMALAKSLAEGEFRSLGNWASVVVMEFLKKR